MNTVSYFFHDINIHHYTTQQFQALLDKHDNIILIDHHSTALSAMNGKKGRYVVEGISGTELVKRFCENKFNIDLSEYSNFAKLVTDYDLWHRTNVKSSMLNDLHSKYWFDNFCSRFESGEVYFTKDEMEYLKKRRDLYVKIKNDLNLFDVPQINGCIFRSTEFVNELCSDLLKKYDIVFCVNSKKSSVSVRHKITKFHLGNALKELDIGGGHEVAAGISDDSIDNLIQKIRRFSNWLEKEQVYIDFKKTK